MSSPSASGRGRISAGRGRGHARGRRGPYVTSTPSLRVSIPASQRRGRGSSAGSVGARVPAARRLEFENAATTNTTALQLTAAETSTTTMEVVPATTSAAPARAHCSRTLTAEVVRVKAGQRLDKLAVQRLPFDKRQMLLQQRRKKQVANFRMPDASPKKPLRRGQISPERVPCPLVAGTPTAPPARIVCPWKTRSRPSDSTLPLASKETLPLSASVLPDQGPPTRQQSKIMLTPSTGVMLVDKTPTSTVDAIFEYIGFSPSTPSNAGANVVAPFPSEVGGKNFIPTSYSCTGTVDAPRPSTSREAFAEDVISSSIFSEDDLEVQAWEQVFASPGSDIEASEMDENAEFIDFGVTRRRLANEFPATAEDMDPETQDIMSTLDQRDDGHLRHLANEDMVYFRWSSDPAVFIGQREEFVGVAGPTFESEGMTPFEIFQQIWDVDIISLIVRETNKYAQQMLANPNISRFARMKNWYDITPAELWTFFGIIMLQSLMSIAVEKEYWAPCLPYMRLGNFAALMTYPRFVLIKKCLHFVDNTLLPSTSGPSRLAKVMPVIEHLNQKFSSLYMPEQNIAIDESLLLWKGRLSWAQLIANKAAQVGIKTYELCESKTGYLWKVIVYTGKNTQIHNVEDHAVRDDTEPEGATSKIVYDLVRPLLNKGHTLVMDNFYNSPLLSRTLKRKGTDTMGTLRLNREFVPEFLRQKNKQTMRKGDVAFSQTEDMTILVWKDANVVSLISTYHKVEVGGKQKHGLYRYKPQVVLDYNLSMGGIDKKDQVLQAFPVERIRNLIWYKKLFRRLLNVSIHNAYVIHNAQARQQIANRQFRVRLADEIIQKFRTPSILSLPPSGHFPEKNPTARSRCKLCYQSKVSRRTAWRCQTCGVSLCLPDCFRIYHTS